MTTQAIIEEFVKKIVDKFFKVRNKKQKTKAVVKMNVNANASQSKNTSNQPSKDQQPGRMQSNLQTNTMGNSYIDPPAGVPAMDHSNAVGNQAGLDSKVIAGGKPSISEGDVKVGTNVTKKKRFSVSGTSRRRTRGVVK